MRTDDDDVFEDDSYYTRSEAEHEAEAVEVEEEDEPQPRPKSPAKTLRGIIADPEECWSDKQDARVLLDLEFTYPRQFRERYSEFVARRQKCKSRSTTAPERAGSSESTE